MRIAVGSDERTELTDDNVLAKSLRRVSIAVASENLDCWFAGQPDDSERANIEWLKSMDYREWKLAAFAVIAHQTGGVQ